MTIFCKLCGHKIQSGQPPDEAQKDVLQQMTNHIQQHQDHAQRLAKTIMTASQLIATYMLIKKFVRIPPEEKQLLQSFDDAENCLLDMVGIEPEPADKAS
jgi:hypothetical protein